MFKVKNKNTRTTNSEHISHLFQVFLLTLNKQMFAGMLELFANMINEINGWKGLDLNCCSGVFTSATE